jgi:hypothetical protein
MHEGAAISGPLLMAKANKFAKDLGYDEFSCGVGWINTFKERHGIKFRKIEGEENAVDLDTCDKWQTTI